MDERTEGTVGFRFLRFSWRGFAPLFEYCVDGESGVMSWSPAPGEGLSLRFYGEPVCVGVIGDGGREPCPDAAPPLEQFPWCRSCMAGIVGKPECVFEPRCGGDECPPGFCRRPHAVYLAMFGTKAKVGMTSLDRLEERLIEQGADGYVRLATVPNRQAARALERRLSKRLRLAEAVRSSEKLKLLVSRVNAADVRGKASLVAGAAQGETGVAGEDSRGPGGYVPLDRYPLKQPLSNRPSRVSTKMPHRGEIIGLKGPFLIYRQDETGKTLALQPGEATGMLLEFL